MLPTLTLASLRSAVHRLLMGGAWLCPILPADALSAASGGGAPRSGPVAELDARRVDELWNELIRRELPDW
ncbi:hypothetical protein [Streptomonospora litoralis]|uniref:Uncharacterized protein n=1 Tax=Streptomonospora litoralis TaxID=2498135 RepID=A0A4P6Q942_9ACTN|nr:hypothetical protein [Streptomonospora litoralis]QBI55567.1 hypothetical protein EKD16_19020 [Streptomonospora litoralis]